MKKILFVVGSLREGSFNKQLAKVAEEMLKGKAEVSYLDYSALPLLSQDKENPVLPAVQKVREEVLAADALWIFSPVYNFAIPGTVKNLLDWLSRALDLSNPSGPSAVNAKQVTVSSVSNGGADQVFAAYRDLLKFIRMNVVGEFTHSPVNPEAWGGAPLKINDEVLAKLEAQVKAVLEA